MFLFCGGRQRNVQRLKTHVHSHCSAVIFRPGFHHRRKHERKHKPKCKRNSRQTKTKAKSSETSKLFLCEVIWNQCFHWPRVVSKDLLKGHIFFCGFKLEQVDLASYLGITVNSKLKWSEHISSISSKASRSLGFIKRNLWSCPREVRTTAYTSIVWTKLGYASASWYPHYKKDISTLERVCDNMRDIMWQYCWVRVRAHKSCSCGLRMADIKAELSFIYCSCRSLKS